MVAHGEPWIWITGGSLALAFIMILGLFGLIIFRGAIHFWPQPLVLVTQQDNTAFLGEISRGKKDVHDHILRLFRIGDYELSQTNQYKWLDDDKIADMHPPFWATVVERLDGGRFHGMPVRVFYQERVVADGPEAASEMFEEKHPMIQRKIDETASFDKYDRGKLQHQLRTARLAIVQAGLQHGKTSTFYEEAIRQEQVIANRVAIQISALDNKVHQLRSEYVGWSYEFKSPSGELYRIPMESIVQLWQPNRLSFFGKINVYVMRWSHFLSADPREANSAGGVFPAIWGTVALTLLMTLIVAPLGVVAALYLSEYASRSWMTATMRIAINNLAGVPSIVYGAFGLGFFCYGLGVSIDELFFMPALLADGQPTYGTGGLLWASLTLALLTLPVVIISTEEAIAAVPNSMRNGSYACGATKWQTIRRIVLPRALPGILTGIILAMARAAGEVAPLMLVGVKKLALDLPIDRTFPYIHPEREFMHLPFMIYDIGFQGSNSQGSEAIVFTIIFLLVAIIAALNLTAIMIRSRMTRLVVSESF